VPEESTAVAVTARELDDYRHMFALDDDTLAQYELLDCASGASAFSAQLRARGGRVLGADPLYGAGLNAVRQQSADAARARAQANAREANNASNQGNASKTNVTNNTQDTTSRAEHRNNNKHGSNNGSKKKKKQSTNKKHRKGQK
jgi:hypothetical protein